MTRIGGGAAINTWLMISLFTSIGWARVIKIHENVAPVRSSNVGWRGDYNQVFTFAFAGDDALCFIGGIWCCATNCAQICRVICCQLSRVHSNNENFRGQRKNAPVAGNKCRRQKMFYLFDTGSRNDIFTVM